MRVISFLFHQSRQLNYELFYWLILISCKINSISHKQIQFTTTQSIDRSLTSTYKINSKHIQIKGSIQVRLEEHFLLKAFVLG
jgi:hypothetical protein